MNKTKSIQDLRFILSKYGNELERQLYPITDNDVQNDLIEFNKFINQLLAGNENQLIEKDFSEKEYSKIVLNEIQKIEKTTHFKNSSNKDQKIADRAIKSVSREIKKAILYQE